MLAKKKTERNVPKKYRPRRTGGRESPGGAAERALRIVAALAEAGVGLGLAELSAELGLPKATLHRLCGVLLGLGWIARDVDPLRYVVGPTLRRVALDTLNHGHVRALRHRVLEALVNDVNETCNFTTLDGADVLYLDRVEARWPLRLTLDVGARVPVHCTASGKLFLAFLPPPQSEEIVGSGPLARFSRNTITDRATLQRECEAIRRQGYSVDREEFIDGLVAVAVPVVGSDGRVVAAIAMHAPTARMSVEQALARLPRLQAAAQAMRRLL